MSETKDIVERLRWSGQDAMNKHLSLGMAGLHADAIAEITRLRSLLQEAVEALEEVFLDQSECQNPLWAHKAGVLIARNKVK